MTFSSGEFDQVQHFHILLDNPRLGVIDAIGLSSGDMTPETWVPGRLHLIFDDSLGPAAHDQRRVAAIQRADGRRCSGATDSNALQRPGRHRFAHRNRAAARRRATHVQWVERPVRINSPCTIAGLQLKDPKAAKPVSKSSCKSIRAAWKSTLRPIEYWSIKDADRPAAKSGESGHGCPPAVAVHRHYQ